jgi:hypothetical protein
VSRQFNPPVRYSSSLDCSIRQQFELNLVCAKDSSSSPELVSYGDGKLVLSWETPSACEKALEGGDDSLPPGSETRTGGGGGFFHVLATMFWLSIVGLILYFAIGESPLACDCSSL